MLRNSRHLITQRLFSRPSSARGRRVMRLSLEALEDRAVPTTVIQITSFDDSTGGGSLRAAILAANQGSGDYDIQLQSGTYGLGSSSIGTGHVIDPTTHRPLIGSGADRTGFSGNLVVNAPGRTITIEGAGDSGPSATVISAAGLRQFASDGTVIDGDRVLHVLGGNVILANLEMTGGAARDNGSQVGDALGGGILVEGGSLTLTNAAVSGNGAVGVNGVNGTTDTHGVPQGTAGTNGGNAQGGGVYIANGSGPVTIQGGSIDHNQALAGSGGNGGVGGFLDRFDGGDGGAGGNAGTAQGGGLFLGGGSLNITATAPGLTVIDHNALNYSDSSLGISLGLFGVAGGNGGAGGISPDFGATDGRGGRGGVGGDAEGGDLYLGSGMINISQAIIYNGEAQGANGGNSGAGSLAPTGGAGGNARGGGIFFAGGSLTLTGSAEAGNGASGGAGGAGGGGGRAQLVTTPGGDGGAGGNAQGGALYDVAGGTVTIARMLGYNNRSSAVGGRGGAGGPGTLQRTGDVTTASPGGNGGAGGLAQGGGWFLANATVSADQVDFNGSAAGGFGGYGGSGGGNGGDGGAGGNAQGGGIYLASGTFTLTTPSIHLCALDLSGGVNGGGGGPGGDSVISGSLYPGQPAQSETGMGGNGGNGGQGQGGAIYDATGSISLLGFAVDVFGGATGGQGGGRGNGADHNGRAGSGGGFSNGIAFPDSLVIPPQVPDSVRIFSPLADHQSATVNTPFGTALKVVVFDPCQVQVPAGVAVTFSAPASGASGTFAGAGTSVTVMTDANGFATPPAFQANTIAGTYTVTASVSGGTRAATFTLTNTPGAADHISFGEPATVTAGVPFPITVTIQDAYNNTVTGYTGTVHFTATNGAVADYTFQPADTGQRAFTIILRQAQTLGITAADTADPALAGGTSFTIVPAAADHLVFLQPPTDTAAGQTIGPVSVAVVDAFGNVVTADNSDTVTLSLGVNPGGGTLSGTLAVTVVNGVVTFGDLSIDQPGTGYTLHATVGGALPDLDSGPFNIL